MSGRGRFSLEDELLLLLARGTLTPEAQDRARGLLSREVRWSVILNQPTAYQIIPLIHRHLKTLGFPGVPVEVRAELEGLCRSVALRNALAVRQLSELLRLFGGAGIPAIPLKGMALADSLYGDLTLRISTDIDILVPRTMVGRAIDLISTRGYRTSSTQWSRSRLVKSFIEYNFAREEASHDCELDLHWGILWWQPLDKGAMEDLWSEARPKVIFGTPAYALSPEWEFMFLAAHAARDCWLGLKWLADIQQACASGGIDWQKVWEKARRFEWDEVLELTASVCRDLVGEPVFANGPVRDLPRWLKPAVQIGQPPFWLPSLAHLHLLKHNSERVRYVLHGLLMPTVSDWQAIRLPRYLRFLYYPIRPFRLAFKFISWTVSAGLGRIFLRAPEDKPET